MRDSRRKRFVVVGCGASACALAAKLCSSSSVEVVLLEQGSVSWPLQPEVRNACLWASAAMHQSTQFLLTAPQRELMGRRVRLPIGSGIGGATNVNAMMFGLGHRRVFDEHWPEGFDADTMGRAAMEVAEMLEVSSAQSCILPSEAQGAATVDGDNARNQSKSVWEDGAVRSTYLATMKDGQRLTVQELLFKLVVKHHNLRIIMNARVQEVLFHEAVAVGVRYFDTQSGKVHEVHTARGGEVILCAGALSTPCLLLQSRLGVQRELRRLYHKPVTPVVKGFPRVGGRILDHTVTPMVLFGFWKPNQRRTTASCLQSTQSVPANSIHGYAFLTAGGKLCTKPDDIPRTQLVFFDGRITPHILAELVLPRWSGLPFWPIIYSILLRFFDVVVCFPFVQWLCSFVYGCLICNVQPQSEGFVMFKSEEPQKDEPIRVEAVPDMNYNRDGSDRDALWNAYQTARQFLSHSRSFSEASPLSSGSPCKPVLELLPGPFGQSRFFFDLYLRWLTTTYFHYAGTCRMGDASDPTAVVDSQFCVKQVSKLRICDASVIPHLPSFPIAATCFAMGNILGEKLLNTPLESVSKKASTQYQDLGSE